MKIVHVQLPHKRREVVMLEELRQDPLSKLIWVLNDEAISVFVPTDNVVA